MDPSSPSRGRGRSCTDDVTVVLCFSFADMASLRALEPRLRAVSNHVHLVPGIDRDLEGVSVHTLAEEDAIVFVVARSASVPSACLEQVIALFGRQRGRNHRLSVVEYETSAPDAFVEAVEGAVQDARARLSV